MAIPAVQEYHVGQAQDDGEVIVLEETLVIPLGPWGSVLRALERSLDTHGYAHEFHAPGIRLIAVREYLAVAGPLPESVNLVPEPGGASMLAGGAALLLGSRRRMRRRTAA